MSRENDAAGEKDVGEARRKTAQQIEYQEAGKFIRVPCGFSTRSLRSGTPCDARREGTQIL